MNFLKTIFKMTESELYNYIPNYLKQYNYNSNDIKINVNNYIYAKGNSPILLVAHLDIIHNSEPKRIYHNKEQNIVYSKTGLGADDRAGIYAILNIINNSTGNSDPHNSRPYILFTSGEEVGSIGATVAAQELEKPKVKYIIEFDRKGNSDAVFYDCYNKKFINYITQFGFIENYGSFSDISILCPHWNIAGVNLSIGYYNAHRKNEYLNIDEMNNTITIVEHMINNLPKNKFKYYTKLYNSRGNSAPKKAKNKNYLYNSYEFYFDDELYTDEELKILYNNALLKDN